jgi:hypothetical protein
MAAATRKPTPTRTPRSTPQPGLPPTITQAQALIPTPTIAFPIVDDFNNPQYEGSIDPELWSGTFDDPSNAVFQQDGTLVFSGNTILYLSAIEPFPISGPYSMEAQYMVDVSAYGAWFSPGFFLPHGGAFCQIRAWVMDEICCFTEFFENREELPCKTITPGTWHWIRIDYMVPNEFDFYIDREFVGTIKPENIGNTWSIRSIEIGGILSGTEKLSHGYVDDFSFGPLPTP